MSGIFSTSKKPLPTSRTFRSSLPKSPSYSRRLSLSRVMRLPSGSSNDEMLLPVMKANLSAARGPDSAHPQNSPTASMAAIDA